MAQNIWQLCLQHLERELPSEDINTFIRPLEIVSSKNRTRLVAPNSYVLSEGISCKLLPALGAPTRVEAEKLQLLAAKVQKTKAVAGKLQISGPALRSLRTAVAAWLIGN